ncbi:MAG: hypothetical protein SLAVMIC_00093 [uncultured marine phage]|uniref:Uncharacterized protein n=1 Tax=uncultured marine phage TaxID=707152 RepID=A0A8D9C8C0_9VIRU|nr:MAG: hypothetical protein SLAVMIC_00093 [uncultured marine phage]
MKILQQQRVQRDVIEIGDMTLLRVKTYNSKDGLTNVSWKFREDMKEVKSSYSERLEKKFLKSQRKKATIIKVD